MSKAAFARTKTVPGIPCHCIDRLTDASLIIYSYPPKLSRISHNRYPKRTTVLLYGCQRNVMPWLGIKSDKHNLGHSG